MANVLINESSQFSGVGVLALPSLGTIPLQGTLATPSNAATAIFAWLPPADGTYCLLTNCVAKKVADGVSCGFLTMATIKVIAGVITIIAQGDVLAPQASGGFAPTLAWAVVGATLALTATGIAGAPCVWAANTAASQV